MAGEIVRPSALPSNDAPNATDEVVSDDGVTVSSVTWAKGVAAGRPLASQAEAEAGVQATKAMTPLATKQAIYKLGDDRFASAAQGDAADTAVQPGDLAAVATSGDYNDLSNKPLDRVFNTVADLIADETLTYSDVSEGDVLAARDLPYAIAASDATDEDVTTAGGVKVYVLPDIRGRLPISAFGTAGDGVTDDTSILVKASAAAKAQQCPLLGDADYRINGAWAPDCSIEGGRFLLDTSGSFTLTVSDADAERYFEATVENLGTDQNRKGLILSTDDRDTDGRKGYIRIRPKSRFKNFWFGIWAEYLKELIVEPGAALSSVCEDTSQYQQGAITCVHTDLFWVDGAQIEGGVIGILSGAGIVRDIYTDNVIHDTVNHGIYSSSPNNSSVDPTVFKLLTVMDSNKIYNTGKTGLKCFSNGISRQHNNTVLDPGGAGIIGVADYSYVHNNLIRNAGDSAIMQPGKDLGAGSSDFTEFNVKGNVVRGAVNDGVRIVEADSITRIFVEDNDIEVSTRAFCLITGTAVESITSRNNRYVTTGGSANQAFYAEGGVDKITSDNDRLIAGTVTANLFDVNTPVLQIINPTFDCTQAARLVRNRYSGGSLRYSGVKALGTYTSSPLLLQDGGTASPIADALTSTGWGADTGTTKRTSNTTYTAATISNPPTQAEVQAIANSLQDVSRTVKSLKDALLATGQIGA